MAVAVALTATGTMASACGSETSLAKSFSQQSEGIVGSGSAFRGEIALNFLVQNPDPEFAGDRAAQDAGAADIFADGAVIDGSDVALSLVNAEASSANAHAYRNGELVAQLVEVSSGHETRDVVAQCTTLDFEVVHGEPFGRSVNCDGRAFTFRVADNAIQVLDGGQQAFKYPLEAGVYLVDGVPVVIE